MLLREVKSGHLGWLGQSSLATVSDVMGSRSKMALTESATVPNFRIVQARAGGKRQKVLYAKGERANSIARTPSIERQAKKAQPHDPCFPRRDD